MSTRVFVLPSRSFAPRSTAFAICAQCRRSFASSAVLNSGHNRWSKIRHEKGAADAKKNTQRSGFAKNLTLWSRYADGARYSVWAGPESQFAASRRDRSRKERYLERDGSETYKPQKIYSNEDRGLAGMPKANIDIAIARGQGKSSSGVGLEAMTLEVMIPPAVAMVIEIETDNKQRVLQDLRSLVKKHRGTVTPTAFLFDRLGRSVLKGDPEVDEEKFDDVMMIAVDAGAEDVQQDKSGNVVVWTQPHETHQKAQDLSRELQTEIISSEIVWSPSGDKVKLDDEEAATNIAAFLTALQEYPDVQGV
ncbi:hypothetical protein Daesc_008056 [Daldinia eschscholtzii]|uniref:TACO1/YebC-like second and third domain-containing protein n=1 Tax=Daldinia eschscholtzii TaxID=292717 RepID=A0AAX6MAR1_9PEZI